MAIYTQTKKLNVIPGKSAPVVVHCSQGDEGTEVEFELYKGAEPFEPVDAAVSIIGKRKDGSGFGPLACTCAGNVVTVEIVSAMTAVAGPAVAELSITETGGTAYTANLAFLIENAAFPDGPIISQSVDVYTAILNYVQGFLAEAKADATAKVAAEALARDAAIEQAVEDLEEKLTAVLYGTFIASGWSASAPYTQTITVTGITADSFPGWDIYPPAASTAAALESLMEARNCVTYISTGANSVTAVCASEKPAVDLPLFFTGV